MYHIIIWHFYRLWNNHHGKSSNQLSPSKLWQCYWPCFLCCTLYPMTYLFCTGDWYFLILFTYFVPTARPHPAYLFFSVSMNLFSFCLCVFKISHICEIMWYLSFSVWLISLSIILSGSTHVVANGNIAFLWRSNVPLYIYTYIFTCSSIDGHLGCFHFLDIVNNAHWILLCLLSFWISVFV